MRPMAYRFAVDLVTLAAFGLSTWTLIGLAVDWRLHGLRRGLAVSGRRMARSAALAAVGFGLALVAAAALDRRCPGDGPGGPTLLVMRAECPGQGASLYDVWR
jgi:hypothetical protein